MGVSWHPSPASQRALAQDTSCGLALWRRTMASFKANDDHGVQRERRVLELDESNAMQPLNSPAGGGVWREGESKLDGQH